jgi:hypothetical protein
VANESSFTYRGCRFACMAISSGPDVFAAQVEYLDGLGEFDRCMLPQDADPYGTAAEALRHAQQQAMRWVNDRTGDGQGQF